MRSFNGRSLLRQVFPAQLFSEGDVKEIGAVKDSKARCEKIETMVFDRLAGVDDSGELDSRAELRQQL